MSDLLKKLYLAFCRKEEAGNLFKWIFIQMLFKSRFNQKLNKQSVIIKFRDFLFLHHASLHVPRLSSLHTQISCLLEGIQDLKHILCFLVLI